MKKIGQLNMTFSIRAAETFSEPKGKELLKSTCTQQQIVEAAQRLADEYNSCVYIWYGNQVLVHIEPSVKRRSPSLVAALATARYSRGPIKYTAEAYAWWRARADEVLEDANEILFSGSDVHGSWKQTMTPRVATGRIDPKVYDQIQDAPQLKYTCTCCGQPATRPGSRAHLRDTPSSDTRQLPRTKL